MKLQFLHKRSIMSKYNGKGGTTYAVGIIGNLKRENEKEQLTIGRNIEFQVGVAKCSPADCFNRKTGRELSSSRLKLITLKITSITKSLKEDGSIATIVTLQKDDGSLLRITQSSESSNFRVAAIEIS